KDNTLIYILSHESQEAAEQSWKAFQADADWIKVRDASEVDGKILAQPPERVFMRLTDYSTGKKECLGEKGIHRNDKLGQCAGSISGRLTTACRGALGLALD